MGVYRADWVRLYAVSHGSHHEQGQVRSKPTERVYLPQEGRSHMLRKHHEVRFEVVT